MYGRGGGGASAFYRIMAIGIMVHARNRHRKHMLKLRKKHIAQQRKARLEARLKPLHIKPHSIAAAVVTQRRTSSRGRWEYTPPPERDLHAGYHAARGGPAPDATPKRAELHFLDAAEITSAFNEGYIPPAGAKVAVRQPAASMVAAVGSGARFPDRSVGAALTHTAPATAPTPAPQGYRGDYNQLVLALTSNGWPKAQAIAKVKAAKLTESDDEAMAIIKCIQAVA